MESQETSAAATPGRDGESSGSRDPNKQGRDLGYRIIYFIGIGAVLVALLYSFSPIFFRGNSRASYFLHKTIPSAKMTTALGESIRFEDIIKNQKANFILVNFFATWCEPCLRELPLLSRARDIALNRGRDIILVNYDGGLPEKTRTQVGAWAISENVRIPLFFDFEEELLKQLGVEGLPFSMVINNPKKQVLWVKMGELQQKDVQFFLNDDSVY